MIDIEITGNAQSALIKLADQLDDLSDFMRIIGEDVLLPAVAENFRTEGGRIGQRWKPSQRVMKHGGETLRDSGRLASSIDKEIGRYHVFVGTNVEYAAIHQFGGKAGRNRKVTIPARPFFGLNAEDEQDIAELIGKMLDKAMA